VFAKHIALGAIDWLKKRGIQPERDGKFEPIEPVVLRPEERSVISAIPTVTVWNCSVRFPETRRRICPKPTGANGKNSAKN